MEKIILTDVDGVLVRWEEGFDAFMSSNGHNRLPETYSEYSMSARYGITVKKAQEYIKLYNEGPAIAMLESFADSTVFVAKLAAAGFRFIAITSLSDHPDAHMYRAQNLKSLFGDVFDELVCLEMGASKAHVLMRWADSGYFWIEDHMRQAEAGHEAGLRTILIKHPYNKHYYTDLFPIVSYESPWEEIYNIVTTEYNKTE